MRSFADERILKMMKKDSSAGMEMLIDTYSGLVSYIIRSKASGTCTEEDVEECVSDVYVEFYRQLDKIDLKKGSIKAYLVTIARRWAIDRFKGALKEESHRKELDESDYYAIPDSTPGPEKTAMTKEQGAFLRKAISGLGEPDTEIIFRRYFLEQPIAEIADAVGMKRPAVSKRIERALERLKVVMEGYV